MECLICKLGETKEGEVTVTLQRGDLTVLIKNVPAQVCANCGEHYLSDDTADQVLKKAETSVSTDTELVIMRFAA